MTEMQNGTCYELLLLILPWKEEDIDPDLEFMVSASGYSFKKTQQK